MTDQQPKRPWWIAARNRRGALIVAIGYTVLFVLFVVIGLSGGSFWNYLLGILAAALAVMEWATYAYFRKRES
ncbi:hypothetical protein [Leifsonia sp. fls2-241-R2A-40a]|uniref:hypothetical protein n=1 Tax=Leifsonia sp. fls2-241-R2A-40a TaxID=3040290 RepID=UPI00254B8E2D|nr:hypothetical protein [Leifsonia sp. fls2-241-R2A-40a]